MEEGQVLRIEPGTSGRKVFSKTIMLPTHAQPKLTHLLISIPDLPLQVDFLRRGGGGRGTT